MASWLYLQYQACVSSRGVDLNFSQKKAVCYSHDICTTIEPFYCTLSYWSLLQYTGFRAGYDYDDIVSLVAWIAPSGTMKVSHS